MRICSQSVEQTRALGGLIADLLQEGDVVVLNGDLGAGKTHFTQGIGVRLKADHQVTSPTFTIVDQHCIAPHLPHQQDMTTLYHFDLYRIESPEALDDIDFIGMIESPGALSIIEWGDRFADELPEDYLEITLRRVHAVDEVGDALQMAALVDGVAIDYSAVSDERNAMSVEAQEHVLLIYTQIASAQEQLNAGGEPWRVFELRGHGTRAQQMIEELGNLQG